MPELVMTYTLGFPRSAQGSDSLSYRALRLAFFGRFFIEPLHTFRNRHHGPFAPDMLRSLQVQPTDATTFDANSLLAFTLVHESRATFLAKVAIELPPRSSSPAVAAKMRRVFDYNKLSTNIGLMPLITLRRFNSGGWCMYTEWTYRW